MSNEIEKASALADELETKRAQHVAKGEKLAAERDEIALGAFTGNDKSRKRIDEIHTTLAKHSSELAALDAGIKAAHQRVADLHAAEVRAVDRQKAEEAQKLLSEFAETFAYADKHLQAVLQGLLALDRELPKLHALGFPSPSHQQLRLAVVMAFATFVQRLPRTWGDEIRGGLRYPAPYERRGLGDYWRAIEPGLQNQITQRLGTPEAARAKEDA
jgi:hypothetical protein